MIEDTRLRYAPVRRLLRGETTARELKPGPLTLVFMAAAPRGQTLLDFEAEGAALIAQFASSRLSSAISAQSS